MIREVSRTDPAVPATPGPDLRERIVSAATRLLQEQGPDAVTTRGVAAAAGVQAPTIYRLFGDKDGLLNAVAQQVFASYVAGKVTHDQTGDPVADLRAGWDTHLGFGLANPALFALLSTAPRGVPSPAAVAGVEILRRRVERMAAAGRLRVPVARVVEMIHAAGTGAVLTLLAKAPEDRDPGLGDEIYEALMRSVLADEAGTPGGDAATGAAITLQGTLSALTGLTDAERGMMAEWLQRIIDRD